jgi:hypothetical protein
VTGVYYDRRVIIAGREIIRAESDVSINDVVAMDG